MSKPAPHHEPSNAGVVILVLFAIAALAQCGRKQGTHAVTDACGGPGSHPVTIGGAMVVACR